MDICEHWTRQSIETAPQELVHWLGDRAGMVLYGDGEWWIAGADPVMMVDVPDWTLTMYREGELPPFFPDLMGWLSYEAGLALDPAFPAQKPHSVPPCRLTVFREIRMVHRPSGRQWQGIRNMPSLGLATPADTQPFSAMFQRSTETRSSFMDKVRRIRKAIAEGDVYQVNLTRQEYWQVSGDDRAFALRLLAANPAPFSALIRFPDVRIISSSPERFIKRTGCRIETAPIKGTVPRGDTPERDRELARFLTGDEKNRSELAMITDLLRNDLSRVCRAGSVRVDGFPVLESFANVHHLVARVSGELAGNPSFRDILAATFPGGSITGCPRIAAIRLINELEPEPRGVYTGAIGWVQADGRAFDLNVAIRTAAIIGDQLRFGLGGGIVWDSDPEAEYEETVVKGASIVSCLN